MFNSLRETGLIMPAPYCHYRSFLTPDEQRLYDAVCRAVSRREQSVTVAGGLTFDAGRLIHALFMDQSMFFYLSRQNIRYSRSESETTFYWEFLLPDAEIDERIVRMEEVLRRIPLRRGKTVLQRELFFHNLLQDMELQAGEGSWEDFCIVGPLLRRRSLCEGASHLFRLLCCMGGVYCLRVSGTAASGSGSGTHAWNMVRLGGLYAHVDAFWDSLNMSRAVPGHCYHFFNLSDSRIGRDHSWSDPEVPACPTEKYSYFVLNGAAADSRKEFRALLSAARKSGKDRLSVRLGPDLEAQACVPELTAPQLRLVPPRYVWSFHETQRILSVWEEGGGKL